MKHTMLLPLLAALSLCAANAFGQAAPPKLRYNPGFFSTRYELGDKDISARNITLHLEKHDAAAYHTWQRANDARKAGWVWCGVAALGAVVGAFSSTDTVLPAAGWGVAAVGLTGVLVCDLNEKKRRERAIDGYNRKYGY